MPGQDIDRQRNRDEDLKPGSPPRSSSEPRGSAGSSKNAKTMTDPATGVPQTEAPEPNQSSADQDQDLDR